MRKSATTADVSSRLPDRHIAEAEGYVFWSSRLFRLVQGGSFPKGNPPETARPSGFHPSLMSTSAHCELVPLGRTCSVLRSSCCVSGRSGGETEATGTIPGTGTSPRFHRGLSALSYPPVPTCRHPPIASLFRSDRRAACSDLGVVCRDAVAVKRKRPAPFLRRRSAICARRSIGKCGYRMSACAEGVAENPAHATTIQTPIQCLQEMCIRKTSERHLVRTRREAPEDARRRPPETGSREFFRLLLLRVAACLFRAFTV